MPAASARCARIPSPIGELLVVGHRGVLTGLFVAAHERCPKVQSEWLEDDRCFDEAACQLQEYFAGTRTSFDLGLDLAGTSFQRRVWHELLNIPFGQTTSYRELAGRIGHPAAARAVGAANGHNPISIIVPCHRVIGGDGSLTGYGWGTKRKAWLLDHERAHQPARPPITAVHVTPTGGTS